MNLSQKVMSLSNAWYTGGRGDALEIAEKMLPESAHSRRLFGGMAAVLKGKSSRAIMLDAHVDEVALYVTSVENGFVKASAAGGIDYRVLPATQVVIHGAREVAGVFCGTPPRLKSDGKQSPDNVNDIYIDTRYESGEPTVHVGDPVTYRPNVSSLSFGAIAGKALDNRAGCAVLLEVAERLENKELPRDVCFVFSDGEEVGLRGARTNAFTVDPDEAIAVDASFAVAPDLPPQACGKPNAGVMIGVSPILDLRISDRLAEICAEKKIPFQTEVMDGATGTDADTVQTVKCGIPTGLCSIPLRNMHTPAETVWIEDLEAAARLLTEYCLAGGTYDA